MAMMDWIYDHSPQVVQNWLDQRAWDKDVDAQYARHLESQRNELAELASRLDNAAKDGWVTNDDYLSGPVRTKLARAQLGQGQTSEQILKRGFLESEANRLGLLSERMIKDLEGPSIDDEAASVFDDRRKYNIEHGIPLTPSQQEEQNKADRLFEGWEVEGDDRDYAALCQEDIARNLEKNEIEAELDEDEYDRAERDDDQEELGF